MAYHTLGSGLTLDVWASTTRCTNLTQHIRIVKGALSHICNILVLMAVMRSQVDVSYELLILMKVRVSARCVWGFYLSILPYIIECVTLFWNETSQRVKAKAKE